jgi:spore coat polysaccharide biosynthesis predicted glycosyltransferase SpsG
MIQSSDDILDDISKISPDLVINDILDTSENYVRALKEGGMKVLNFEDLGPGAKIADAVVNALYPEKEMISNHYFGYNYFCPRDEFLHTETKKINNEVRNVLISFGGTDACDLTKKNLDAIHAFCGQNNIKISVILGLGYAKSETLKKYKDVSTTQNVNNISDYMLEADIIFTSAGRTVYEAACIGTPAIILAQNERELTHFFASPQFGFVNLGLGQDVEGGIILETFIKLCNNFEERKKMSALMLSVDLKNGKKRTIRIIKDLLEN